MALPGPAASGHSAFGLRITLRDVEPDVWRRVLVPGSAKMGALAEMLLAAMGWNNSHSHVLRVGTTQYVPDIDELDDDDDDEGEAVDEKDVTVLDALRQVERFTLEYDFGDGWEHDVQVEELAWYPKGLKFGVCLDGGNACPPDDVGGPSGYAELREAMADPEHEEHAHYLELVGASFDPALFELATANALLQRVG